ncbi:MAG: hypothetical protein ACI4LP_07340 [Anaerovoracaceae bacterium]
MSNRELYKQTFSHLHTDHTLDPEGVKMKMQRNKNMTGLRFTRRILVTAIIMTLMLAMAGISYAATDGAVLDSIMVWINGQPAGEGKVTVDENGTYTVQVQEGDKVEIQSDGWSSEAQIGDMEGDLSVSSSESEDGLSVESNIIIDKVSEDMQ